MRLRRARHNAAAALLALAFAALPGLAHAGESAWKPVQNVEIVSPSGPAGAIDKTARLLQELLKQERLVDTSVSVVNKPGGSHSIGYAYLAQHAGDPHYLLVTSVNILTNNIAGTSRIQYADFTPIALLFNDYVSFTVGAGSPLKSARDLAQRLKDNPGSISIAVGSSAVGTNYVTVATLTKIVGGDPKKLRTVTFKSAAEGTTALLGGHIDVTASSVINAMSGLSSGSLRTIAVAAPRRLAGPFSGIPTWKELGVDLSIGNWRMLFAPGKLTPQQIRFWEDAVARVVATPRWTGELERTASVSEFMNSQQTKAFLEQQDGLYRKALANVAVTQ